LLLGSFLNEGDMQFENSATVGGRREDLWDFLMDIPRVAACIPGVEDVSEIDPDQYRGTLGLRVGPIKIRFEGRINVTERDRENWRAIMEAEGTDKGASGKVKATITLRLNQIAPDQTEILMGTQASILGRLGEFGQPVMRKKADELMKEFAKRLSGAIEASG
jgi:carbon monoxide dehydrogenase subunit G